MATYMGGLPGSNVPWKRQGSWGQEHKPSSKDSRTEQSLLYQCLGVCLRLYNDFQSLQY
jgi:hypothetical protein